jgi:hypothetical protein
LFVDKVHDIVGLYLNPPIKAMVLCVDENSQIQALGPHATDLQGMLIPIYELLRKLQNTIIDQYQVSTEPSSRSRAD